MTSSVVHVWKVVCIWIRETIQLTSVEFVSFTRIVIDSASQISKFRKVPSTSLTSIRRWKTYITAWILWCCCCCRWWSRSGNGSIISMCPFPGCWISPHCKDYLNINPPCMDPKGWGMNSSSLYIGGSLLLKNHLQWGHYWWCINLLVQYRSEGLYKTFVGCLEGVYGKLNPYFLILWSISIVMIFFTHIGNRSCQHGCTKKSSNCSGTYHYILYVHYFNR